MSSDALKILVVDDSEIMREMNLRILTNANYTVELADGGEQALLIARDFRPDIVLLDLKMPGLMGDEVCRRMRAEPACSHTKIIMVSSSGSVADRLRTYTAGADDYVTKPFQEAELLAKIRVYSRLRSLEEVEHAKDRVMEVLQHTTRTPLQNIQGYADLLKDDIAESPAERQEFAQVILEEARRLQRLLEKSELLAKMKSGQMEINRQRVNLRDIANDVVSQYADRVRNNEQRIHVQDGSDAWVTGDQTLLGKLVSMVLDNAIRFSPAGGDIDISLDRTGNQCVLQMIDSGPGIPEDLLPMVFDSLGNVESPLHNTGDGLDLSICREIVATHRGTISARNEPGRGAAITVTMPCGQARQAPKHTSPVEMHYAHDDGIDRYDDYTGEHATESEASPSSDQDDYRCIVA